MKAYKFADEDVYGLTEFNAWKINFDFLLNRINVAVSLHVQAS